MGVTINDNNKIPQVLANIAEMNQKKARVGYFGDDYSGGEITTKGIARVHEFGVNILVTDKMRKYLSAALDIHLKSSTTHINIPERSFLRNGSLLAKDDVVAKAKDLVPQALLGNVDMELFFEMLGIELRGKIQDYAIELSDPPNHPKTVAEKGSSNPLVDSGNMIEAMEVRVE